MKRIIIISVSLLLVVGVVLRLKFNHDKINVAKTNSGISNVVNVITADVTEQSTNNTLEFTGTLSPSTELTIASQTQGQITDLNIELGQTIAKGSVIATIDNKLKQLALNNAKISEAKLKKELERYQNLFAGGTATQQQLDDIQNSYDNARIQREQAEKQLADATIIAPITGTINQKSVEKGSYVNIGSPIATIIDITTLKVKVNASETNVYKVKKGDEAVVSSEVYPDVEFKGLVSFVSDKGDESHNYPIEIVIENNNEHQLKAGTFVKATLIALNNNQSLYIPREALIGSTQDASVYVATNGKAVLRKITVVNTPGANLRILSGLRKSEKVVVTGQINLTDGKSINIVNN